MFARFDLKMFIEMSEDNPNWFASLLQLTETRGWENFKGILKYSSGEHSGSFEISKRVLGTRASAKAVLLEESQTFAAAGLKVVDKKMATARCFICRVSKELLGETDYCAACANKEGLVLCKDCHLRFRISDNERQCDTCIETAVFKAMEDAQDPDGSVWRNNSGDDPDT